MRLSDVARAKDDGWDSDCGNSGCMRSERHADDFARSHDRTNGRTKFHCERPVEFIAQRRTQAVWFFMDQIEVEFTAKMFDDFSANSQAVFTRENSAINVDHAAIRHNIDTTATGDQTDAQRGRTAQSMSWPRTR